VILGSLAQALAANDAPVSAVDASANVNSDAVMQMICMHVAESTIRCMSDPLEWWADNGVKKLTRAVHVCILHLQMQMRLKCSCLFALQTWQNTRD